MRSFSLLNATPSLVGKLFSKIHIIPDDANACWEWRGTTNKGGYGVFVHEERQWVAHRTIFYIVYRIDPADLLVCHKCDNRRCCNANHLFLGTHDDNQKDMARKGRACKGDNHPSRTRPEILPRGENHKLAKLTDEQVIQIRNLYATGQYLQRELAVKFHVAQTLIGRVVTGAIWTHLPLVPFSHQHKGRQPGSTRATDKVTEQIVQQIRQDTRTQREIAIQYGITQGHVSEIKSGKKWGHVH